MLKQAVLDVLLTVVIVGTNTVIITWNSTTLTSRYVPRLVARLSIILSCFVTELSSMAELEYQEVAIE